MLGISYIGLWGEWTGNKGKMGSSKYQKSLDQMISDELKGLKDLEKYSGARVDYEKDFPFNRITLYNIPEGFLEKRLERLVDDSKSKGGSDSRFLYDYSRAPTEVQGAKAYVLYGTNYTGKTASGKEGLLKLSETSSETGSIVTINPLNLLGYGESESCPSYKNPKLAIYKFLRGIVDHIRKERKG